MIVTETRSFDFHELIPKEYRTEHEPLSPHEYALKQCEWYNESQGNLDGIDCPQCKNRGYFQILDNEDNPVMRECQCMAVRKYVKMMKNSGLGDLYEKCTFDAYEVNTDWQKTCKVLAIRYAQTDGNGWLLFSGQSGTGKTHLCTAICSELAKRGRGIRYIQWKRLFDKLVQTKYKLNEQEALISEAINADVLYLDDFLKMPKNAPPTGEMLSFALEIIDARYKADKKTILSTEFMQEEIIRFDEALGGRINEKSKSGKIQVRREAGRNYRMGGAK